MILSDGIESTVSLRKRKVMLCVVLKGTDAHIQQKMECALHPPHSFYLIPILFLLFRSLKREIGIVEVNDWHLQKRKVGLRKISKNQRNKQTR